MVRLLEVPLQSPRIECERDDGIGEEVDARALRAVAERVRNGHIQQTELGIDRRRFPDAAAVALAAHPGGARDVPALIFFILWDRVEVPEHLACFRVDREHMAARDVAFAAGAADINHAVVVLRRRGEPVAQADRRFHFGESLVDDVEDHARLAALAEGRNGLPRFRIEREQKRSSRCVDHTVGVADAAVAKDVAFPASAANQVRDVESPEQVAVGRVHGVNTAARIGHIHHAVHNHRRRLVTDAIDDAVLEQPSRRERFHV